ncbi:MAG: hypothetical protein HC797_07900 [Anaerolineales bacterium]|nr:hypothetical protein [Anaerolineales bacterium]
MPTSITGKTLLNQYHIDEFITHTPLGELYRVTDERTNKPLALTLLSKEISDDIESIKALETKSKKLQSVQHPNLVKYFGFIPNTYTCFFARRMD